MPNLFDRIKKMLGESIGVSEAESNKMAVMTGTPQDLVAIEITTLNKFWEFLKVEDWFTLIFIDPKMMLKGETPFLMSELIILLYNLNGKWEVREYIPDKEQTPDDVDLEKRLQSLKANTPKLEELLQFISDLQNMLDGRNEEKEGESSLE